MHILVVEDYPIAQNMMEAILTILGYKVDIAGSGQEAVERFQQHTYDFIFMDIGLPDFDGHEATRRIRALEKKTQILHVPIVALTAHLDQECRNNALASGMDDFLNKPLTKVKAAEVIAKYAPH